MNIIGSSAVISSHNYDIEVGKHFLGNCLRPSRYRRPLLALEDMALGAKGFRDVREGIDANTLSF